MVPVARGASIRAFLKQRTPEGEWEMGKGGREGGREGKERRGEREGVRRKGEVGRGERGRTHTCFLRSVCISWISFTVTSKNCSGSSSEERVSEDTRDHTGIDSDRGRVCVCVCQQSSDVRVFSPNATIKDNPRGPELTRPVHLLQAAQCTINLVFTLRGA